MKRIVLGILACVSMIHGQNSPDTIWVWSVPVIDTTVANTGTPSNVEEVGMTSYENIPDVRIHPTTNTTQSEMSVAVNPLNPNIVLVSANTTDYPTTQIYGTGWYLSLDGGSTWIGSDNPPTGSNHGDPATAIGRNGYLYIGFIAADYGQGIMRSTDNGQTWEYFTVAEGGWILDKNHLCIDNSETSPFEGRLYSGWTDFRVNSSYPVEISYSSDYGETWSTPDTISKGLSGFLHQGVNIRTGPNGEVYAVWSVYPTWPDVEREIGFNRSLDGGESWESPRAIIGNIKGIRTSSFGPYGIRANSFPSMAVDLSNGPHRGRIYVVWTNQGYPGTNVGDPDIYLIYSDDRGETWSSPIRVNQDPEGNGAYQWFPWITVDNRTGIVYVVFYDGRNHIGTNMAEVWVAKSIDGGQTFEDFPVSDIAFSVGPLPGLGGNYNGDYIGIAALGGRVYPVWNAQVPDANSQAWTSPFTDIAITLLWPNAPGIVVEEADTYAIRYNGDSPEGIENVVALFSYDGGQNWPDTIGHYPYDGPPYPTHVENDSILWPVTQHPTKHGRVKVVLYDAVNQTAVDISSYDITVKLARPGNVVATASSNLESITLTWIDRSNYEDGYRIQRREPGGDWHNLATLQQNATSYTDNSVDPFSDYEYRIWAFKDNGVVSDTVYIKTTTDGLVRAGSSSDHTRKAPQIAASNGLIHTVFSHRDTIFYSYSQDGGKTWSSPIIVGYGYHPSIASEGNYTAVVWDKDNYIYYRVKSGDEFLPATSFKPSGTRIESYNPAVKIFADSAIVAFGANNDHYPFVLYKVFGVTNPPSGVVPCDTIWVYNHHLDSLGVKGIDGFGTGNDRYTVVTFWSYGYINTYAYDYEMHMYEKLPGSEFWQDGLGNNPERYAQYISNPAVDSQKNRIYVAFSNSNMLDLCVKNIGSNSFDYIYDTLNYDRIGPLFVGIAGRVTAVTYLGPGDSVMGVFLMSREPEAIVTRELQLAFDGTVPAGIHLYRRSAYSAENYYAVIALNRTGYNIDGRYGKNSFVYQYNPTVSPLQREERSDPVKFAMRVTGVVAKNGMLQLEMAMPEDGSVKLSVYDATGREIASESRNVEKGLHGISFKLDAPSGVYFVRAEYGNKKLIRKFMVVR